MREVVRSVPFGALLMTLLVASTPGEAHNFDGTSCRITWRDGHVELTLQFNLTEFWQRVEERSVARATPDGGATREGHLSPEQLLEVFKSGMQVRVDGEPVPWTLRGFPPPPRLQEMRASAAATQDHHVGFVTVRVQAAESRPTGMEVGVTLPMELGDTIYSFVEPRSQAGRAGQPVTFARSRAEQTLAVAWSKRDMFSFIALILSLAAMVLHFRKKLFGGRGPRVDHAG